MGRVRFYDVSRETYVSLRVESDGLYLGEKQIRQHKERKEMPPRYTPPQPVTELSRDFASRLEDTDVQERLLVIFDDIQDTLRLDPKGMVSIKAGYKGNGYQIGICYRDVWSNYAGKSLLEALIAYYDELAETDPTPPTPLKRGGGSRKAE